MSDNLTTKREIEKLLAGEEITKEIHQELIYPEMYQSLENVWSLLFMTGYLRAIHFYFAKLIPVVPAFSILKTQPMTFAQSLYLSLRKTGELCKSVGRRSRSTQTFSRMILKPLKAAMMC